ncbi:MAG: ABC transporter permease [Proteobacteria bacterium]|nr:ABC transporter permease [Pseudomonadota bacterium]
MLALTLARRGLRAGTRGLLSVVLCLALGVAAIAAVGSLRAATEAGIAGNGRTLLGGDVAIGTGAEPPPPALRAWLTARGARLTTTEQMRTLLVGPSGARQLISLRAVGPGWPLLGAATLRPALPLARALGERDGRYGLLADPLVLSRLGLRPGATARIGTQTFAVRSALVATPDLVSGPALFGAPAVIAAAALPGTGLVVPGALISYTLRAVLPDPAAGPALRAALRVRFASQGWRIRGPAEAAPGITQFITLTSRFMALVGLTALLMGGIGVAGGVSAWLAARAETLAILRCLGGSARLVFAVCLTQVAVLAAAGIALGLVVGALVPVVAGRWLGSVLPVPVAAGVYPGPLALAAVYGALTAGAFALWPLGQAAQVPGAALFRGAATGGAAVGGSAVRALWPASWQRHRAGQPGSVEARPADGPGRALTRSVLLAVALLGVALVGLAIASTGDRRLAVWFCAAALATLVLFRAAAWALARAARVAPAPRQPWARLGLGNLYRPGAPTAPMLVSVGLGLSTLAAVALIQGNLNLVVLAALPARAPSFFFIDLQPSQLARFRALVHATPGPQRIDTLPTLRARIVAVNGVPAADVHAAPGTGWALRGDRGLTYAATPPAGTKLVGGTWWAPDYRGPPLVSLDARLAAGWGVRLGGVIRVNVLGRDIDLRVASLRDIRWQRLGLNFVLVASPGLLSAAPHTEIATVHVARDQEGGLLRRVSDALPNVTGIAVRGVLAEVATLLDQIAAALAATGAVTLLAGALVLVSAVAAGQRRRVRQAVILKTLGATRAQIRAAWMVEFGALGLTAGLLAAGVGGLASWAVLHFLMHLPFVFLPGRLALGLLAALAMLLGFGYIGTARALRVPPASQLRDE